jgi:hypothetical protein
MLLRLKNVPILTIKWRGSYLPLYMEATLISLITPYLNKVLEGLKMSYTDLHAQVVVLVYPREFPLQHLRSQDLKNELLNLTLI